MKNIAVVSVLMFLVVSISGCATVNDFLTSDYKRQDFSNGSIPYRISPQATLCMNQMLELVKMSPDYKKNGAKIMNQMVHRNADWDQNDTITEKEACGEHKAMSERFENGLGPIVWTKTN